MSKKPKGPAEGPAETLLQMTKDGVECVTKALEAKESLSNTQTELDAKEKNLLIQHATDTDKSRLCQNLDALTSGEFGKNVKKKKESLLQECKNLACFVEKMQLIVLEALKVDSEGQLLEIKANISFISERAKLVWKGSTGLLVSREFSNGEDINRTPKKIQKLYEQVSNKTKSMLVSEATGALPAPQA